MFNNRPTSYYASLLNMESAVSIEDLQKPLYEKLRVVGLEANLEKQDDITQELVYTAKVEKFSDGAWAESTDLEETQKLQLNWFFIKNNDEMETEVVTDNPTDDDITIDGLTMKVTLQDDNIQKFGHAHCFVNSPEDEESHACTELKRQLDVEEVLGRNLLDPNATEVTFKVELNIDSPTDDELKSLTVELEELSAEGSTVNSGTVAENQQITHTLEADHKVLELHVKVYPKEYPDNSGQMTTYFKPLAESEEEVVNARGDDNNGEYIGTVDNGIYHLKADTNLEEGMAVTTILHVKEEAGNILKSVERESIVENGEIAEEFDIEQIIEQEGIDGDQLLKFKGEVQWEKA